MVANDTVLDSIKSDLGIFLVLELSTWLINLDKKISFECDKIIYVIY